MGDSIETQLLQTLGENFLAYITASTPETICRRLTIGDEPLEADQEAVLSEVAGLVQQHTPTAEHAEWVRLRQFADVFGAFDADAGTTTVNVLRKKCRGQVWQPAGSDPVEQELLVQLRDIYPLLLLPDSPTPPFDAASTRLNVPLLRHPHQASFDETLMGHDVLMRLFPPESGSSTIANDSADLSARFRASAFVGQLIGAGWGLACLSSKVPTLAEHVAGTKTALTTLIAALQGKAVTIPIRVGLTGLLLPEGCTDVDLGWARLRPSDARDENPLINNVLPGMLQGTDQGGATITIKYSGDIILEMDLPYHIKLKEIQTRDNDNPPKELNTYQTITKHLESLRLGLLLAADTNAPVSVVSSWIRIIDPLGANVFPSSWSDPRTIPSLNPWRLTIEQVDDWKRWTNLVHERRQKSVEVSIRRVLLATERREPEDMLVDAVIVWENLFGTQQETMFRVTSSLAWLLADGIDDRKAKYRQFKDLYGLRSRIVHGEHQLKVDKAQKPYEALQIALNALRVIFRDRPDLLGENSSADRSNRILLGD
jgi:hypothetical protein